MGRKGRRIRLDRNIFRDGSGIAVIVRVGEWCREDRFPANTPLRELRNHRDDETSKLRHSGVKITTRGTLAADVDVYLAQVGHLAGWVSLRAELRAWVKLFPDKRRRAMKEADALYARQTWLDAGLSPKTITNREAALTRMWHRLDGRRSVSPTQDLPVLARHKSPIVRVKPADVLRVYQTLQAWEQRGRLRDAKTRARFMVLASTGRRPSEVMRAEPGDADLDARVWNVRDGKGGWSPGVYLNDDMLAAWKVFIAAEAWGKFREGSFVKTIRAAGWPAGVRPYQMRHSVGIAMSESGTDLADVQQHMGHTRIDTTRRHYVPVLGSRLQQASERIDRRFGW